jgi:hypothetical protein
MGCIFQAGNNKSDVVFENENKDHKEEQKPSADKTKEAPAESKVGVSTDVHVAESEIKITDDKDGNKKGMF